jgi:signal transduction histidine kinase/DNA-binding response OmpR family regulator
MKETHPNAETSSADERPISSRRILWQLSVFLIGLLLLLALHAFFTYLIDELAQQTINERARLFVGEQIVGDIQLVESGVYRMATTLGKQGQQRVRRGIGELLENIRYNLDVLRTGGVARQVIRLNLEGRDRMIKEVQFNPRPDSQQQGYILEVIDLTPKLKEIEDKVSELAELLKQREELRKGDNQSGLFQIERRIKIFLKKLPPLFTRLTENANRMFYESHQRLTQIEQRIAQKTQRYRNIELLLVTLTIILVMLLGLLFAGQIKRNNNHLANARDRMREAKEEAERANRAKSEFLSRMSHELRTPLNAVLGFAQLLAIDSNLSDEQRDGLAEIDKAGRHLLELINEILDLAKIEAGRLQLEQIDYSMADTAHEIIGIMTDRAHDKGLELHAFVSPRLPASMLGDPTRVKQVLLNLLGNAVKFTEHGDVGLHIAMSENHQAIRCEVTDSGIGFDTQTRQRLFQPFTQADESTTRKFGGSGLGLIICKELIEAMGGRIEAESEPGKGSRFWFELPIIDATTANPKQQASCYLGKNVLVVDGFPATQRILQDYLSALGARPHAVTDQTAALDALQRAQSAGAPYTLVLIDKDLQSEQARSLAQTLNTTNASHKPILGLLQKSGERPPDWAGLYDLSISKPVSIDKLKAALEATKASPETAPQQDAAFVSTEQASDEVRILLADDQHPNRLLAESMLRRLGVRASSVADGQEAVEAVQRGNYDLIFMDMQMPGMDGVEATRQIRRLEAEQGLSRTPIVAMTANAMKSDREACLQAGMDEHLPKPISLASLDEQLRRWIPSYAATQRPTA